MSTPLGNGDGSFQPPVLVTTGQAPVAVAVADIGSQVTLPDGSTVLGPPDGIPDLIVANNGIVGNFSNGPPDIVIVPGLADGQGHFNGFGSPFTLAAATSPLDLKVADVNHDGVPAVVVAEANGIEVIYGKPLTLPPDATPQTARNLGVVVHLVEPTQTLVPGHEDAYYRLTVPTEAARGAGYEILDFSGFFQALGGAGLSMEVTDAAGNLLGSGERFRVAVPQGAVLTLHVFGVVGAGGVRGSGAYTLDIDVLPQVVSVAAQSLLPSAGAAPGGPTTSIVLTLQGDRLDPAAAQNPANYTVTYLGPFGDQVIPLSAGQSVVYDPSSNVDVASGVTYPTAVRQTITLLFDEPLPAGSYRIELAPAIQAASFSADEPALLSAAAGFSGHPVASLVNGVVTEGDDRTVADLVSVSEALGNLAVWQTGTPFLTQLHDDLGALLDAQLTALGDAKTISAAIDSQIVARFDPALGAPDERPVAVLVIWLDPVPVDLVGSDSGRVSYNLQENSFVNTFGHGFVSVAGNMEVVVLPFVPIGVHDYVLSVNGAPAGARGGVEFFGIGGDTVQSLTSALRAGTTTFALSFGEPSPPGTPSTPATPGTPGTPGTPATPRTPATPQDPLSDPSASVAALLSLPGTRSETPVVTSITPLQAPPPPASPSRAGAAAPVGDVASVEGGGGDSAPEPASAGNAAGQPLARLLTDLARLFQKLVAPLQGWFRAFNVGLTTGDNRPAEAPEAGKQTAAVSPGKAEPAPIQTAESAGASPEHPATPAGGSLAAVLCVIGYFARRNVCKRPVPDGRKNRRGTKTERSRRPDNAG